MARTLKYNTHSIYSGPNWTGQENYNSGDISQFQRVTASNFDITIERTRSPQLGSFSQGHAIIESPFISMNMSYLPTDGENEQILGFIVNGTGNAFSDLIQHESDLFIRTNDETVLAVGNCAISNYIINAAVGNPISCSVGFRGFSITAGDGITSSGEIPRVDTLGNFVGGKFILPPFDTKYNSRVTGEAQDVAALRPSDMEITWDDLSGFSLNNDISQDFIQSLSLGFTFERKEVKRLSEKYPFYRNITYPVRAELGAEFILSNHEADTLSRFITNNTGAITVDFKSPCGGWFDENWEEVSKSKFSCRLEKLQLISSSDSLSIDSRKRISVKWEAFATNINYDSNEVIFNGNHGPVDWILSSVESVTGENGISGRGIAQVDDLSYFSRYLPLISSQPQEISYTGLYDYASGNKSIFLDTKPTNSFFIGPKAFQSGDLTELWFSWVDSDIVYANRYDLYDPNSVSGHEILTLDSTADNTSLCFDSSLSPFVAAERNGNVEIYDSAGTLTGSFVGSYPQMWNNSEAYYDTGSQSVDIACFYLSGSDVYVRLDSESYSEPYLAYQFSQTPHSLKCVYANRPYSGFYDKVHLFGLYEDGDGFSLNLQPWSIYQDFEEMGSGEIVGQFNETFGWPQLSLGAWGMAALINSYEYFSNDDFENYASGYTGVLISGEVFYTGEYL